MMLLAVAIMVALCAVASATTYYVTGNNVRLRVGPGTDYEIADHVSYGHAIDVVWTGNGWAEVVWGSMGNLYISTKYISRNKPNSGNNSNNSVPVTSNSYKNFKNVNYYVIVNPKNTYVNMRWEASKASEVRRIYYYGTRLRVLAENGSWCQVYDEATNEVGFIMKSLLLGI